MPATSDTPVTPEQARRLVDAVLRAWDDAMLVELQEYGDGYVAFIHLGGRLRVFTIGDVGPLPMESCAPPGDRPVKLELGV